MASGTVSRNCGDPSISVSKNLRHTWSIIGSQGTNTRSGVCASGEASHEAGAPGQD
jgi:hypothetical protein